MQFKQDLPTYNESIYLCTKSSERETYIADPHNVKHVNMFVSA
jgi:hypothetical protein